MKKYKLAALLMIEANENPLLAICVLRAPSKPVRPQNYIFTLRKCSLEPAVNLPVSLFFCCYVALVIKLLAHCYCDGKLNLIA